jgi:hypothetical protein
MGILVFQGGPLDLLNPHTNRASVAFIRVQAWNLISVLPLATC